MKQPTTPPSIESWFALEHEEGTGPPGLWACAGRLLDEYGVFLGAWNEVQNFVPESRIAETIADLKLQGEADLARVIEGVQADVGALRMGRLRLVRDLAGRNIQ